MTIRLSLLGLFALGVLAGCITPQDHGRLLDGGADDGSLPGDGSMPGDASAPADAGPLADGASADDAAGIDAAVPRIDPALVILSFERSRREPYMFDGARSMVIAQVWVYEAEAVERPAADVPLATEGPCVSRRWPGVGPIGPPTEIESPARFLSLDPGAMRVFHDGVPAEVVAVEGSLFFRAEAHGDADTVRVELTIPGHPTFVRERRLVDPPSYPMPAGEEGIRRYRSGVPLEVRHGPSGLPGGVFWTAILNSQQAAVCEGDGWDGNVVLPWTFVSTLLGGDEARGGIGHQAVLMRNYTRADTIEDGIPTRELVELMRLTYLNLE